MDIVGIDNQPISYLIEITVHQEFMSGAGLQLILMTGETQDYVFDCLDDRSCALA